MNFNKTFTKAPAPKLAILEGFDGSFEKMAHSLSHVSKLAHHRAELGFPAIINNPLLITELSANLKKLRQEKNGTALTAFHHSLDSFVQDLGYYPKSGEKIKDDEEILKALSTATNQLMSDVQDLGHQIGNQKVFDKANYRLDRFANKYLQIASSATEEKDLTAYGKVNWKNWPSEEEGQ